MKPLAIDLFCGLGGWTSGLLAAGYHVIGFDIERHEYDGEKYPATLCIQDVLTLHGSQFRDAALIVASPPCQEYSYMAMPWSRAKAKAAAIRADETGKALEDLNRLFNACFRIQREACEAASGRHIPMVVENVRGAQPWVGRAQWNFGSYYLWGDVPALMPPINLARREARKETGNFHHGQNGRTLRPQWGHGESDGRKVPGFRFDGSGKSFQSASVLDGRKRKDADGYEGNHPDAFGWKKPRTSSKSSARKAASARIAKIPFDLAFHIARTFLPRDLAEAA